MESYHDDHATLGDRLTAARESAGFSLSELAKRVGVRNDTLKSWENDQSEPRVSYMTTLAGCLGVSLSWLMSGVGVGPARNEVEDEVTQRSLGPLREDLRATRKSLEDALRRLDRLEESLTDV